MLTKAVHQLFKMTAWGALDYLIVDTPPGTGDIHLSLAQTVDLAGSIIISTPQKVALADARKGIDMYRKMEVPVLGLVQNMASFLCPSCGELSHVFGCEGASELASEEGIPLLGSIPLDPALMAASDSGQPLVISQPQSAVSKVFSEIAQQLLQQLEQSQ